MCLADQDLRVLRGECGSLCALAACIRRPPIDVVLERGDDELIRRCRHADFLADLDYAARQPGQLQPVAALQVAEHRGDHGTRQAVQARKELVDRLLEYEKYKAAAQMLYERSTVEQAVFARGRIESDDANAEINASVFDLLSVFQKVAARYKDEVKMEIAREEISLADMIKTLKRRIFEEMELNVQKFFEEMETKRELVTAFIAVLEIVRTESVKLTQKKTFGEIVLKAVTNGNSGH